MLGPYKIIVDEWAETWDLLKPYSDGSFWQWPQELDPEAIYIVGRVILKENYYAITEFATQHPGHVIFCNPAEGSQTILLQLQRLIIRSFVEDGRIGLITSGDLEPPWHYCQTDGYFSNIVDYVENRAAATAAAVNYSDNRPYDFLFLNGRLRPHRKWLIDCFRQQGILDKALWTNLNTEVAMGFTSVLQTAQHEPVRLLPPEYEIDIALPQLDDTARHNLTFAKHYLFNDTWGDAIVNPRCYTDTWFSVITETIYDYPYTFRTEKIWKPILMAHPFVVFANAGYYRSLRDAGFRTFDSVIDESFDSIQDSSQRIAKTAEVVYNIVKMGPEKFWAATRDICKYNQQHLLAYNYQQRQQFPRLLEKYLDERFRISS